MMNRTEMMMILTMLQYYVNVVDTDDDLVCWNFCSISRISKWSYYNFLCIDRLVLL